MCAWGLLHEMDTVVASYAYSFGDRKKRMAMVIFYGQRVEDNCYGQSKYCTYNFEYCSLINPDLTVEIN